MKTTACSCPPALSHHYCYGDQNMTVSIASSCTENTIHTVALFQNQVCCLVVYCLHRQLPSKRLLTIGNVIWAYLLMQTVKYYVNEQQGKKSDRFVLFNKFTFIQYCTKAHHWAFHKDSRVSLSCDSSVLTVTISTCLSSDCMATPASYRIIRFSSVLPVLHWLSCM